MGKARVLVPDDDPEFVRFWAAYPKHVAKKEARLAWAQLQPSRDTVDKMIVALQWQARLPDWLRDGGQFIPHPASWLRAERWDDEPPRAQINGRTARTLSAAAEILRQS